MKLRPFSAFSNVLAIVLAGPLLDGCGSSGAGTTQDAALSDAGVRDGRARDATSKDVLLDRGTVAETGTRDGRADTGRADARIADSPVADTTTDARLRDASSTADAGADTSPADVRIADALVADTTTTDAKVRDASSTADARDAACTTFSVTAAETASAAMVVLDRSASMSMSGKWTAAQTGMVQALTPTVFNTMSVGLDTYPTGNVGAPACLLGLFPPVACGVATVAQVAVESVGANPIGTSPGARYDINQFLQATGPDISDTSNSSPMYEALSGAYAALKPVAINRRAAVLVVGTGPDCAAVSSPTRPGYSDGLCADWEEPTTLNSLITAARTDATTPIETFVIGLPGTNSDGAMEGNYTTAPYSLLLALSTFAVSGSPETVDPSCDATAVFTQGGAPPAHPCHVDLSNAATLNATTVASAVEAVRQSAFGCIYDIPTPPMGQTINPALVNVTLTLNGTASAVPRRASAAETCSTAPCWDYDAEGRVSLLGVACTSMSTAAVSSVALDVGCPTISD